MCFPSPLRGIPRFAVFLRLRVCRRKLCVTMIIHHVSLHFNQKSVRPSKNFCAIKQFQDKMKRPPLPCMGAEDALSFYDGRMAGYYWRMTVPVRPAMPSRAFSSRVMRASRPGLDWANFTAASTLGSMEPGANWPWAI